MNGTSSTSRLRAVRLALILSLFVSAPVAHAHGGPPRLELGTLEASPGSALEIRGINMIAQAPVRLLLLGAGAEFPLGEASSDSHGDFTFVASLPAELAPGEYVVHASAIELVVHSVPLTIAGPVLAGDDGQGELRDQSEPLLAPPPSGRVSAPALVGQQAPGQWPASDHARPASLLAALLSGIGIIARLGYAVWTRRSPRT